MNAERYRGTRGAAFERGSTLGTSKAKEYVAPSGSRAAAKRNSFRSSARWGAVLVAVFFSALKLACFPLYRSTDFEVHRNWMALTRSRPVSRWYFDNTSEWTLDYPPLFAWFEYALSFPAGLVDPAMVDVENLGYASRGTVYFMRTSVIVTDLVFGVAAYSCADSIFGLDTGEKVVAFALLFGDVNLFMVDHMHFQYNGLLNGLLFLSIACLMEGRNLLGAFYFAVLLNFKHIYLYVAPAFFFYLLFAECFRAPREGGREKKKWDDRNPGWMYLFRHWLARFDVKRFLALGLVVTSVFAVSLGPFLAMGQAEQLKERLFPFKRGLTHAYWAPNFWALYNTADKVLAWSGLKLGLLAVDLDGTSMSDSGFKESYVASSTSGRVEEFAHRVLPSITPKTTFLLTAPFIALAVVPVLRQPSVTKFLESLVLCAWASFLFGWHVHEKAILMITLPLLLLALRNPRTSSVYFLLQFVATFSLFPLFFTPMENVLKFFLWVAGGSATYGAFLTVNGWERALARGRWALLTKWERRLLLGAVVVYIYQAILHCVIFGQRFPFLPLMAVSVYCACVVIYCWVKFLAFSLLDRAVMTLPKQSFR